jgi:hypothetical protein
MTTSPELPPELPPDLAVLDALIRQVAGEPVQEKQPCGTFLTYLLCNGSTGVWMLPIPIPTLTCREHRCLQANFGIKGLVLIYIVYSPKRRIEPMDLF